MQNILLKKAAVIFALIILLMIALSMTSGVISERSRFKQEAKHNIAKSWTGEQRLIGPILVVPYYVAYSKTVWDKDLKKEVVKTTKVLKKQYIMPDELLIDGVAKTHMRSRGMYAVPVYSSTLDLKGYFSNQMLLEKINKENNVVSWGQPYISVYINDIRGIPLRPEFNWQDQHFPFVSGTKLPGAEQGMHVLLPNLDAKTKKDYDFSFTLELRGMENLSFAAVGMDTEVKLKSDWPHPSFTGAYLPEQRTITEDGFSAIWRVSSFSSNIAQQLTHCKNKNCGYLLNNNFGVSLYQPVDVYQQSERSTKYGILFISITFIAFWVFELIKKLPIHPVQYLLVGFALSIFYLLLISLSEHIAFLWAYCIAAISCTGLLGYYLAGIMRSFRTSALFTSIIALLYAVLYVIICLENTALLMGAGLLFVSLTLLMVITRHIDWYSINAAKG
jgi:inner membrane protein